MIEKTTWYKKRKSLEKSEIQDENREKYSYKKSQIREKSRKDEGKKEKKVKAVIFVPYTHDSYLAKKLREAELKLEDLTGYRLKVIERAGTKLEHILHKSDPWSGKLCGRWKCLICNTKKKTGKDLKQNCTTRSAVYETWCNTCAEKDAKIIGESESPEI